MMKKSLLFTCFLTILALNMGFSLPTTAKKSANETTTIISAKEKKREQKIEKKLEKKKAKWHKRFQKTEKKLAKKGIERTEARSVWEDENFKLGALIALGGLLLTILGVLPILGGIFTFIGGLMMVVGVGLMIWALIESY